MTYEEAEAKLFTVPWKTEVCSQGESCWCRIITPVDPIVSDDGEDHYIVHSGSIHTELAEYIVSLHNGRLRLKMPESKNP